MPQIDTSWALAGVSALLTVVWWLLRQKDAAQEKEIASLKGDIKLLWDKHDVDVNRLTDLELKVASGYYEKRELDGRLDRFEQAVQGNIDRVLQKVEKLADAIAGGGA